MRAGLRSQECRGEGGAPAPPVSPPPASLKKAGCAASSAVSSRLKRLQATKEASGEATRSQPPAAPGNKGWRNRSLTGLTLQSRLHSFPRRCSGTQSCRGHAGSLSWAVPQRARRTPAGLRAPAGCPAPRWPLHSARSLSAHPALRGSPAPESLQRFHSSHGHSWCVLCLPSYKIHKDPYALFFLKLLLFFFLRITNCFCSSCCVQLKAMSLTGR